MARKIYIFPNIVSRESSNFYDHIDIPLENRDYNELQPEIQIERNISENPSQIFNKNVDEPTILITQYLKNNFSSK